uniref:NADH-ubiquinone oxidoreductase chain 2 n=1 Tax=Panulirus japonicus TaxID=6736 RepID=Q8HD80_PANJA|nr:NADH dehydrogenase subunit 2 [Panulirus japonicus]BAC16329.1 NADH dehydrogenase subunit 2 [Panulirus japonicus]
MLVSLRQTLFICVLVSGTVLALSSNSWFMAWVGLELNLMSFIPLMTSKKMELSCEAALKYFLIQAVGSALVIFSAPLLISSEMFYSSILLALLVKVGAAPFHFWLPAIVDGLNWVQLIILMTVQKVAPLFLISIIPNSTFFCRIMMVAALLSSLIGSIGGLNQTSLRKILAFSSINHIGWMLASMTMGESSWLMYFSFYVMISSSICLLFNHQQLFWLPHLVMNKTSLPYTNLVNSFSLLSLGGLPPFTGFIPKWIVIESLSSKGMILPLLVLIVSSLITLYFYLRLSMSYFMLTSVKTKMNIKLSNDFSSSTPVFISMNMFFLLAPTLFILI